MMDHWIWDLVVWIRNLMGYPKPSYDYTVDEESRTKLISLTVDKLCVYVIWNEVVNEHDEWMDGWIVQCYKYRNMLSEEYLIKNKGSVGQKPLFWLDDVPVPPNQYHIV